MWNDIFAMMRKEISNMIGYRFTLLLAMGITFYVGIVLSLRMMEIQQRFIGGPQAALDLYITFFFVVTALIMSWGLISLSFLMEKIEGTLETLLTTPLPLFTIWAGKTLAVSAFGYIAALFCFLAVVFKVSTEVGYLILPSLTGWLLLALAPLSIFALVGLSGLLQLIIPQPGIGRIVPFGFVFLIFRIGVRFDSTPGLSLVGEYLLMLGIAGLLAVVGFRFLTKEQLVLF